MEGSFEKAKRDIGEGLTRHFPDRIDSRREHADSCRTGKAGKRLSSPER